MTLKILKKLASLLFISALIACGGDDDSPNFIPERDRTEQQLADKDSILMYLSTHYYNSSFFETGTNHKYSDIMIYELDGGAEVPDGHTLLSEAVEVRYTTYFDTDYEYYVLNLNQGSGEAPKFTDEVRVRYEGFNLETDNVFDSRITPEEILLQGNLINTFGAIRAWQLIMPTFNSGFVDSINNGIVNFSNYGLGVMFVPSGLAYFSGTNTGSSYANLVFKFELLQIEEEDHDNDGIPSYIEDLDNDTDVVDDDTDTNNIPNFIDNNDDGDSVLTRDELQPSTYTINVGDAEPVLAVNEYEISRSEEGGIITINTVRALDTNNNGVLDYLDDTVSINYNDDDDS